MGERLETMQGWNSEKKRVSRNITPLLHPKLRRRMMYKRYESEVSKGGDWGAGHVGDGDIVILKVF